MYICIYIGPKKIKKIKSDSSVVSLNSVSTVRAVRQSTLEKTVDSDVARKKVLKAKVDICIWKFIHILQCMYISVYICMYT
jgi:hypothetical protein